MTYSKYDTVFQQETESITHTMKRDIPNYRSKISFRNDPHGCQLKCRSKETFISTLNRSIDAHQVPMDVNETNIENMLEKWEHHDQNHLPEYWLVAARLFEMSILLAGHYVDHCEFKAAGDLLFNPRRVHISKRLPPPYGETQAPPSVRPTRRT